MRDERIFLSIDFEDLAHDLKRDLGLWETGPLRVDALWSCYEAIDELLRGHEARATFFCTGIVGVHAPDLISRIAADGHEVACHYHFHDELRKHTPQEVDTELQRAKATLERATNAPVIGFRAPKFRIDKSSPEQYRVVERHFVYDSSYFTGCVSDLDAFRTRMGLTRLKLLPVFSAKPYRGSPQMRLGGSFMKLAPAAISAKLVDLCLQQDMIPHVYIHPYEMAEQGEFMLSSAELEPLGRRQARYWSLRQMQWNRIGNRGLRRKVDAMCDAFGLRGRLCDNLDLFEPGAVAS